MSAERLRLSGRVYPVPVVKAAAQAFSKAAHLTIEEQQDGGAVVTFSACRLDPQIVIGEFQNYLVTLAACGLK